MLSPIRLGPSADPVDIALGQHLDAQEADAALEAAAEAIFKSDYLDDETGSGFSAEFFEECFRSAGVELFKALEKANAGYTGNYHQAHTRGAIQNAGKALLSWMEERAWELSQQAAQKRKNA